MISWDQTYKSTSYYTERLIALRQADVKNDWKCGFINLLTVLAGLTNANL